MYVPDPNVENLPFDLLRERLCLCRYFTSACSYCCCSFNPSFSLLQMLVERGGQITGSKLTPQFSSS